MKRLWNQPVFASLRGMFGWQLRKYRKLTDEALVQLFKQTHDKSCVGVLYERYAHLVIGSCMHFVKRTDEAEDIASGIFEHLHEKLLKHDVTYFKSWLFMVTRNECMMHFRRMKKQGFQVDIPAELTENEVEDSFGLESKLSLLEGVLSDLKEMQRICLRFFYFDQLSYEQISEKMNIPVKEVKSHLQNGKRNLKIRLIERDEFKD
jgi:RNA polymerase sigma-70 factor (ECF subfamily)